ncbi:alpha/beta fold hydrolase [Kribbella solani]|uniref:alpha/beta fold hydrolase n=1 Tax=Kribbella solani TaxID=236067 RepID=UPI0029B92E83|nr:alpha/beta hydrolase [Kribbella solani]MDX2970932.1 alpha/beta hydrolase [Kribbella solani]
MTHYEDAGGPGQPVLALHGTFGRGRTFAALANRLRPDYRLIAPDLRGHGATPDRLGGDFSREAFVADAARFIETHDLAPALVIGHSLGGVTAYQLAARHPELVRAVVVEDVGAIPGDAILDVTGWPTQFADRTEAAAFFAATPAPEYFLESVDADGRLMFDLDAMMAAQRGNVGGWWADWLAVRQPLLLLRATNSFLLGADHAAEMVRRRPGTRLVTFADTGHWIHREAPDAYAEAVRGFFRSLPGSTTSRPPAG